MFVNWIPLEYPEEIDIKKTTATASFVSFLDIYLQSDTYGQFTITSNLTRMVNLLLPPIWHVWSIYYYLQSDTYGQFTIRFWYKVDYCLTIMSYDGPVCHVIFR